MTVSSLIAEMSKRADVETLTLDIQERKWACHGKRDAVSES
jgi:hypothetical protein